MSTVWRKMKAPTPQPPHSKPLGTGEGKPVGESCRDSIQGKVSFCCDKEAGRRL